MEKEEKSSSNDDEFKVGEEGRSFSSLLFICSNKTTHLGK